ncbi:MAG: hypothetical protein IH624_17205 [Phycisphaerae bacterium]|nr:hypothetical protein [Phycisphaerae bacterium]
MKNSTQYAKEISKLYRSLKKKHGKVTCMTFDDPAETLVYAIFSEHQRSSAAKTLWKRIGAHFVDLNDLRVSRSEEICDVLGSDSAQAKRTATAVTDVLNAIFRRRDRVSLVDLRQMGKRQARKELERFKAAGKFAIDYCFLVALEGHAIPLTPRMVDYLKADGLVDPTATDEEIAGFLERRISAADAYEFYALLRRQSETSNKSCPTAEPSAETDDGREAPKKPAAKKKTAKRKKSK